MNPRGLAALFGAIVLFSTIEVDSKLMQTGGGVAGHYPFWLACIRFLVAGVVLLIPALRQLRRTGRKPGLRGIAALAGLGLLGVSVMSGLYHLSITFLPANVAALVFSCNPVFVILFAPLILGEKITVRKVLAAALCVTGIAVLAQGRAQGISAVGLALMLTAILIFAVYTLLFKKVTPLYGALPVTAFVSGLGGFFLLPVALLAEGVPFAHYGMVDWLGISWLALAGTALAYLLFVYGIAQVEAGVGSMTFFLKPFLAAVFAWAVLGETLSWPVLAGGGFILGGMAVAMIPWHRRKRAVQ